MNDGIDWDKANRAADNFKAMTKELTESGWEQHGPYHWRYPNSTMHNPIPIEDAIKINNILKEWAKK